MNLCSGTLMALLHTGHKISFRMMNLKNLIRSSLLYWIHK